MSMRLYSLPEVYHSSWIEMKPDITMRYEVDHANELATLYFGHHNDYVITLSRDNLTQLLDLGTAAKQELAVPPADDQ
jgi:hypothetical protein